MKAAVFYEADEMRIEDVAAPELGPEDLLVEVGKVGICGSDVEYYRGRSPVGTASGKGPLVLGHEFMGRVCARGAAVPDGTAEIGDRVAVNPIQSCNCCRACRSGRPHLCSELSVLGVTTNGAFAERVRTHASHAYELPEAVSDDEGAFVEPLAAAVNAVEKAEIGLGDLVVLCGPGPIGLAMVQLAKSRGATVVLAGTRRDRLAVGEGLGADLTVDVSGATELGATLEAEYGQLADKVIVATSSLAANEEAARLCAPGATIVFMAVTAPDDTVRLPMLDSLLGDRTIKFSLWYPNQWPRAIKLLEQKVVDPAPIITSRASLDDLSAAIGRQIAREDGTIKTIVSVG